MRVKSYSSATCAIIIENSEDKISIIYLLKTISELPETAPFRDVILIIVVTGGDLTKRIASSINEATQLFVGVKKVAECERYHINRKKHDKAVDFIKSNEIINFEYNHRGTKFVGKKQIKKIISRVNT